MSIRKALAFSFIDRYSGLALMVLSTMIVARLLTPADLGVFSVASGLLLLSAAVRDMGAGQYLVQTKELDAGKIRAVWTLQFGIGLVMALLIAAVAYPFSIFFDEPRMAPVLLVLALGFLVNPFGAITHSMLMRHLRFKQVAVMRFSSNLVGASVTVSLAYAGWGPLSLALGALSSTTANAIVAQAFRDPDMPWGFNFAGLPQVLSFGGRIAGAQVVNGLLSALPDFALGRLQSLHAAGIYSRSFGLVSMFSRLVTEAVYNVAVAMFSEKNRAGGALAEGMLRALAYMTVLNWVFVIYLVLLAEPVTMALYGSQWGESVELTRILAVGAAFTAPVPICIAVTTASGRADRILSLSLWLGLLTAALALGGAMHSLRAMAVGMAVASLTAGLTWLRFTSWLVGCSAGDLVRCLSRSALVALLCTPLPIGISYVHHALQSNAWLVVMLAAVLGAINLLGALLLAKHPLANELKPVLRRLKAS